MRFDRHSRRNPRADRQDQSRLLRMVGLLVMLMVLIQLAARPESWHWLEVMSAPVGQGDAKEESDTPLKPINIHRPGSTTELPHGTVYARVDEPDSAPAADGALPPSSDVETSPTPDAASLNTPLRVQGADADGMLPKETFEGVQDDWFGLTRTEQPALVRIVKALEVADGEWLRKRADRDVSFDALLNSPEYYRGRPLVISGKLRRLLPAQLWSPEGAIDVWEAYVIAPDSRNTPYLVFCATPPAGVPQGDDLNEPVTASAYFVRRFAYATQRGEAVTSMFVAPTLKWNPVTQPSPQEVQREMGSGALLYVGIVAVVVAGVLIWFLLSDRRFRRSRMHSIAEARLDAAPSELARLADMDGGDPHRIRVEEPVETTARD